MARPEKSDEEKLSRTVAFRLTEGDHSAYKKKFHVSGLTQSEFFRRYVLTNTTTVHAIQKKLSPDAKQAVFLLQKCSNNVNQLAHKANLASREGKLSENVFVGILDQLSQLTCFMLSQADRTKC
ncbi:MAG: plasmid mobilization relaxosome protein MobC [Betaproteobacteria bacterium]